MTFDELMNMALSSFVGKYDTQEGSFLYTVLAPAIYAIWEFYDRLNDVDNMVHPNEHSGSYIDADAEQYGIKRKEATKATAVLTITGDDETKIPVGSLFYDNIGNEFITNDTVTILNGTAQVSATSVEAGSITNAAANTIVNIGQYITGLISVTNKEGAIGGEDEESDVSLYQRLSAFKKRPATSGNAYSYEQWALSVAGVGAAKVYPLKDGPGTVNIVIASEEKMPVSKEIEENVLAYINEQKPIGVVKVNINSVVKFPLNITADINKNDISQITAIENSFTNALTEYFKEISMNSNEVKINAVGAILMNIDGVIDYTNLKINGETSNIEITAENIPSVEGVILNAIN